MKCNLIRRSHSGSIRVPSCLIYLSESSTANFEAENHLCNTDSYLLCFN